MSPKDWESAIDRQIREAMERGDFDNLPGKGRPLDLTPNPYAAEQEMAFKILKDAGYAPEWIELDKAIRERLDRARATLTRSWEWHQASLSRLINRADAQAECERTRSLGSWQASVAAFKEEVTEINKQIGELNLKVPNDRFQRFKIDATEEVKRLENGLS